MPSRRTALMIVSKLGVVLGGLQLGDPRLGDAKLLSERSLAQLMLGAVAQEGRRELASRCQSLPLGAKAGV